VPTANSGQYGAVGGVTKTIRADAKKKTKKAKPKTKKKPSGESGARPKQDRKGQCPRGFHPWKGGCSPIVRGKG
jgi:hypothetical protein